MSLPSPVAMATPGGARSPRTGPGFPEVIPRWDLACSRRYSAPEAILNPPDLEPFEIRVLHALANRINGRGEPAVWPSNAQIAADLGLPPSRSSENMVDRALVVLEGLEERHRHGDNARVLEQPYIRRLNLREFRAYAELEGNARGKPLHGAAGSGRLVVRGAKRVILCLWEPPELLAVHPRIEDHRPSSAPAQTSAGAGHETSAGAGHETSAGAGFPFLLKSGEWEGLELESVVVVKGMESPSY